MTFIYFWARLSEKSPKLKQLNTKVEIDTEQFKRLLQQAYDQGVKDSQKEEKPYDYKDLFKGIF